MASARATTIATTMINSPNTPLAARSTSLASYRSMEHAQHGLPPQSRDRRMSNASLSSASSTSSTSTLPSYATFRRQFMISTALSLCLALIATALPLLIFRDIPKGTKTIAFLFGAAAYLSSDSVKAHLLDLFGLTGSTVFQDWILQTAPVIALCVIQETTRFGAAYIMSLLLGLDPASADREARTQSAVVLASGFAFAEVVLRNLGLWQHVSYYRKILQDDFATVGEDMEDDVELEAGRGTTSALGPHEDVADFLQSSSQRTRRRSSPGLSVDGLEAVEQLVRHHHIRQLEDVLGGRPLYDLPAILLALWTLKTFLLSNVLSTILLASGDDTFDLSWSMAYIIATLIHVAEVATWSISIPRLGLAVLTYVSFIGNLGLLILILALYGLVH